MLSSHHIPESKFDEMVMSPKTVVIFPGYLFPEQEVLLKTPSSLGLVAVLIATDSS